MFSECKWESYATFKGEALRPSPSSAGPGDLSRRSL